LKRDPAAGLVDQSLMDSLDTIQGTRTMLAKSVRWVLFVGSVAALLGVMQPGDCRSELFRKKATLRTGLPSAAYGHDDVHVTAAVTTSDAVEEQVLLVLKNPTFVPLSTPDIPWQNSAKASADSLLARPGFNLVVPETASKTGSRTTTEAVSKDPSKDPVTTTNRYTTTDSTTESRLSLPGQMWTASPPAIAQPVPVRRKSFAPKQPSITAEFVTLDRIGLAIYETGHISCTGLISHSGGPDGLVRSNSVTLRVRGYGVNRLTSTTYPNGPLHFEFRNSFRVLRGQSEGISLVPCDCCETIRSRFDEITHLEVILESRHSR
jgi:hypothetical protein